MFRELIKEIQSSELHITLTNARTLARKTYSGWDGWHHNWHWTSDDRSKGIHQLRDEALAAAKIMGQKCDELEQRRKACYALVDVLDLAIIKGRLWPS